MNDRVLTHYHEQPLPPEVRELLARGGIGDDRAFQHHVIQELKRMSKATDDLVAAVTALTGAVSTATGEIQTLTAAVTAGHADDDTAAVEDAVAKINALTNSITSAVGAANAAVTAAANQPDPSTNPAPTADQAAAAGQAGQS